MSLEDIANTDKCVLEAMSGRVVSCEVQQSIRAKQGGKACYIYEIMAVPNIKSMFEAFIVYP